MRLCLGQGGWVPQMEATLGKACEEMEVSSAADMRLARLASWWRQ